MIRSLSSDGVRFSHGIERSIRAFSGAHGARVIAGGNTAVPEHSHDWPVLSFYVMGDYRKAFDGGETRIRGPSVVLHPAGEAHANRLNKAGLEQIDVQFDPRWIGADASSTPFGGVRCWIGGHIAAIGGQLASLWCNPVSSEWELAEATGRFVRIALGAREENHPAWVSEVLRRLQPEHPPTTVDMAEQLGLHPGWLAQAYRAAMGEGIRQTIRRRRVEHATTLLRGSDLTPAEIAAAAGFCDQSHMNRGFRQLLGRTPLQVRAERSLFKDCND